MTDRRRRVTGSAGLTIGVVGVLAITVVEIAFTLPATVPALLLLVPVTACSALSGSRQSLYVALLAAASFAVFSVEPVGSPAVRIGADLLVLATFIVVAITVGQLTNRRRAVDAHLLDARRVALLQGVSHDLRSPLTTIRAISSDLLNADELYDDLTRGRMLERVVDESARLDRIVGNLLSATRIQAGALEPDIEAESLGAVVEISVRRLLRADRTRTILIDVPHDLPLVDIDPVQVDQVLTNLLENALRHGGSPEPIRVEGRWPSPAAGVDYVEVSVIDHGRGFSPAAHTRMFEPFNSSPVTSGSTGLGLVVCQAIVEAHGGTIWLRARGAGGAQVSFTLPVAPAGDDPPRRG